MSESAKTTEDVACTMCGCVCDDVELTVEDNQVTSMSPGCPLAEPWMLQQDAADVNPARIDGEWADVERAVKEAAKLLAAAQSPLVYGLSRSSTPGQRAAVRLADQLGACIDTTASTCHAPSIMALQAAGESTCSLGEIRHRSDLVVYWGSNPLISHPRHVERYVDAPGQWMPGGRSDRHVVVVDVAPSLTSEMADTFIQVEAGADFDLIWALRAMVAGLPIAQESVGGVSWESLNEFAERMKACHYGAVFFGLGLTKSGSPHTNVEALLRLVTDLNAHTRFVARRMRVPGDVAGADTVLCWQTGFPFSVNLARGYPRFNPGEYTADSLLSRAEVDAAILIGSEGIAKLSHEAQRHLNRIPTVVLDYPRVESPISASVEFTTAVYGIHRLGTAYRMDEVPIPLRKVIDSPLPADHEILLGILQHVRENQEPIVSDPLELQG